MQFKHCIKHESSQVHKRNTTTDLSLYSFPQMITGDFQCSSHSNSQLIHTKINREKLEIKDLSKQIFSRYLKNISAKQKNICSSQYFKEISPNVTHKLRHKARLNRNQKNEISSCTLSEHQTLKLR